MVEFNFPHPNDWSRIEMYIMKYYIKRRIGLQGDTLSIRKGVFKVKDVDTVIMNDSVITSTVSARTTISWREIIRRTHRIHVTGAAAGGVYRGSYLEDMEN